MEIELLSCWDDGIFYVEEFRPIAGYEGIYEISSFGRIKSLRDGKKRKERILKQKTAKKGYLEVSLSKYGKSSTIRPHRFVALHFIPNPENKPTVNHKKGIKIDNRFFMLEWATSSENSKESYRLGLQDKKGEKNTCAKLTPNQVLEIRAKIGTKLQREIAEEYGVTRTTISLIHTRKNWSHI